MTATMAVGRPRTAAVLSDGRIIERRRLQPGPSVLPYPSGGGLFTARAELAEWREVGDERGVGARVRADLQSARIHGARPSAMNRLSSSSSGWSTIRSADSSSSSSSRRTRRRRRRRRSTAVAVWPVERSSSARHDSGAPALIAHVGWAIFDLHPRRVLPRSHAGRGDAARWCGAGGPDGAIHTGSRPGTGSPSSPARPLTNSIQRGASSASIRHQP